MIIIPTLLLRKLMLEMKRLVRVTRLADVASELVTVLSPAL